MSYFGPATDPADSLERECCHCGRIVPLSEVDEEASQELPAFDWLCVACAVTLAQEEQEAAIAEGADSEVEDKL